MGNHKLGKLDLPLGTEKVLFSSWIFLEATSLGADRHRLNSNLCISVDCDQHFVMSQYIDLKLYFYFIY